MSSPKLILLEQWGAAYFDPPPSLWTLRRMAREGRIRPEPVKVGKACLPTVAMRNSGFLQ